MSRLSSWLLAGLLLAIAAPAALACPGSLTIGLPLLFGAEEPSFPWPMATPLDARPSIDLTLPIDYEEAQEFREPPARQEQAKECLKAWRQLVRDGRFERASVVAAKAASLDPTSLDAQQAVIVSQVLRTIGDRPCYETKTTAAAGSCATGACAAAGCASGVCAACPSQSATKYSAANDAATSNDECIVQFALQHLFPGGLLTGGKESSDCRSAKRDESKCGASTATAQAKSKVYYVGGLLFPRQLPLPVDYDLTVVQAVALTGGGMLVNGGFDSTNKNYGALERERYSNSPCQVTVIRQTKDKSPIKLKVNLERALNDPREDFIVQHGDILILEEYAGDTLTRNCSTNCPACAKSGSRSTPTAACGSAVVSGLTPAGHLTPDLSVSVKANGAAPAAGSKRVSIKAVDFQVECDRVVSMNDREMVFDGNVVMTKTIRERNVTVSGSRIHVNLTTGNIQVDGARKMD